jgi:hypothetical protein
MVNKNNSFSETTDIDIISGSVSNLAMLPHHIDTMDFRCMDLYHMTTQITSPCQVSARE